MTTRWPCGRPFNFSTTTTTTTIHLTPRPLRCIFIHTHVLPSKRQYAQKSPARKQERKPGAVDAALPPPDAVKSALEIVSSNAQTDPLNPPRSTLPPPLTLPTRGNEGAATYYWRIGKSYARFYKDGVKAVWYNYRASSILHQRLAKDEKDVARAAQRALLSRAEFQLLARNRRDIGKLPFFGLLVVIFGEWLPFLVPWIPNAVPGTCRIPKQVTQMREKAEERRRRSFREGIAMPSEQQLQDHNVERDDAKEKGEEQEVWPIAFNATSRNDLLRKLRDDQLYHLSTTLGLHSTLWDRIQLSPPAFLLRRSLSTRLQYLALDDHLLIQHPKPTSNLSPEELHLACSERGLDILGRKDHVLRENLAWWLRMQERNAGSGRALLAMLFRRPNVWGDIAFSSSSGQAKRA